jgi:hypothetical protein
MRGAIRTAATIVCSLCGVMIDGMGGTRGHGPICLRCGDVLKNGRLRGAVKWGEE